MKRFDRPTFFSCPWCSCKSYLEHSAANHARHCRPNQPIYKRVWVEVVDVEETEEVARVKDSA